VQAYVDAQVLIFVEVSSSIHVYCLYPGFISDDDQDVVVWDRSGPTHNPSALAAVKLEPGVEETADSGRMDVDEEQAEPSQKQQSKKKKKKKKKTAPAKRAPTRVTRSSMPVNVKLEPGLIAISPFEVAQMIRDFVREEAKSAANVPTLTAIRKRFNTTQPIAREAFLVRTHVYVCMYCVHLCSHQAQVITINF
jgi:hypothetical protein